MTRGLPRGELVPSPTVTEHLQHVLPLTINAADLALGDGGPLLFDCRSEEDYDEGHISGATLLQPKPNPLGHSLLAIFFISFSLSHNTSCVSSKVLSDFYY